MVHKERRCNLFDDNGRPRRLKDGTMGCHRDASACHFVHPHERDWKDAHPSLPPRPELVADSDSAFYYIRMLQPDRRERDIQRRKSSSFLDSPPHRRDSAATHPSPGPPSSRRSTFDSAIDGSSASKRGRSPAFSSTSDQLERLRRDNQYRGNDLPPPPRDYRPPPLCRSRSRSRDKGRDKERADLPRRTPPAGSHAADTCRTDPPVAQEPLTSPPEPPKPPPVQPPPPPPLQLPEVPKMPSFASNQQTTGSAETAPRGLKELTIDEQRTAWHERIDLIFTSITSRRDYAKLESDLSQISLLSNSPLVDNMSEADRVNINVRKKALESQSDAKRKEISETLQKLVGSNFWPVLRVPQISEMEKMLEGAKKHVLEVRSLLNDVKNSCAALFKTSTSDWTQDSDRPTKRRRLDGEADTPERPMNGNAETMTEDTAKELDAFRDKLIKLGRHLVDLENDINQRDAVISDEIELWIDARLEEEDALYPAVREPAGVSQAEIEAVVDAKNEELARAVTRTGEDIGVLAVEVAELITKVGALEARCRTLEAENQEFKGKLAQDSFQYAKSQDALVRRDKEIEAIAAALQAYISQAPAGQTLGGDLPSAEYIIESLGSQLDGLFRDKFSAMMVDTQQEVFDKVQESHKRTLDTVSPKIMLLLKMVNLITARLGKPDMDPVNTA